MFDHLIGANKKVRDGIAKYGLEKTDISFIKDLIKKEKQCDTGRNKDKNFLYEIVANERSGIDVDKWDYFQRDCHNLGITSSFDCHRFMKFSRVIKDEKGEKQICARDKEVGNLYDMFYTRYSLHRRAYQHKVTKIIEIMLVEALVKANDHFLVKGKEGKKLKMSEAIHDMVAYTKLTDDIILQIMRDADHDDQDHDDQDQANSPDQDQANSPDQDQANSPDQDQANSPDQDQANSRDQDLAKSRAILKMVQQRELYEFIGEIQPPDKEFFKENTVEERDKMKEEIIAFQKHEDNDRVQLTTDQLIIHIVNLNFGKGQENPIDNVRFYSKAKPDEAFTIPSLQMFKRFAEQRIRVYCRRRDDPEYIKKARECFHSWCVKHEYIVEKANNVPQEGYQTPESQKTSQHPPKLAPKSSPAHSDASNKAARELRF